MKIIKILIALLLLVPIVYSADAVIYENEACGHCTMYLSNLKSFLEQKGLTIEEKYIINDESARLELSNLNIEKNIPIDLQGHLVTVINDNFILEGHIPIKVVEELFEKYNGNFPDIVLYQDSMSN